MRNDPRRLRARHAGRCVTCHGAIRPGQEIIYWPIGSKTQCLACGEKGYLESLASFQDERAYNSCY